MCGLCATLLGGGCTLLWLANIRYLFSEGPTAAFLLLVSLGTLAGGLCLIWLASGPVR